MTEYRRREIVPHLRRALEALPVVVLTGLRQTGKTTLLRRDPAFRSRRFLTLDDLATLEAAKVDPEGLVAGSDPLTIDEIQRAPELLVAVKRAVDRDRRPGRFLLSGSANLALLAGVSETLAGRAVYVTLEPFTRRETRGTRGRPFLARFMEKPALPRKAGAEPIRADEVLLGGMPTLATGETTDSALWFLGYEQTYLERDVRDLSRVADLISFRNLLHLAALRTGQVLNRSELGRDARLPAATASRQLDLMETTFVLRRLAPYLRNRATRLIRSPKIYVADSGIAAHLTATRDLSADEPLRGALLETHILQNVRGLVGAHLPEAELAFWSVQGRHEVDLVVTHGRRVVAIEIKAAARFGTGDLGGLRTFQAKTPGFAAGILAYNGTDAHRLGEGLFAIPLGLLLS